MDAIEHMLEAASVRATGDLQLVRRGTGDWIVRGPHGAFAIAYTAEDAHLIRPGPSSAP
jgi:hypothetical protein